MQETIKNLMGWKRLISSSGLTIKKQIAQALSPAKNVTIKINEEEKVATVSVRREELSLAIGKEGQNVRIASKLTGYRIEIEGKEEAVAVEAIPPIEDEAKEVAPAFSPRNYTWAPVIATDDAIAPADDLVLQTKRQLLL